MERRVRGNSHARCGTGENLEIISKSYLSLFLCFDTEIDAETFCKEKSAIFIILPEENPNTYFMVSLFLQQFYREMLQVADEHGGTLPNRVMIYADEIGTIPKIDSFEMMLSAGRSRKISVVPIIQSFAQLRKNYGDEGAEIITDNTQVTIFGGFAPNSQTAEVLSKAMGSRTVMSGSISRGKNDPSQSLQMMERALMTPDELKSIPKGNFVVMKTGTHPMKSKLKLFLDWGISFEKPYITAEKAHRKVHYADKKVLEDNILKSAGTLDMVDPQPKEEKNPPKSGKGIGSAQSHEPQSEENKKLVKRNKRFNHEQEVNN